jgi:hydrogen peroxide-dependent heme synthase
MTEDVTYAYYAAFRRRGEVVPAADPAHEWEVLFKEHSDRVRPRGFYDAQGLRPDTDLLMWWVAPSMDDVQALLGALRRTSLGRGLELTHAFTGAVRPPEFNPQHLPAFLRGEAPRRWLCVYPFVRSPEWYLQPAERRAELLREHGEMGREFPDVLPNTTSAFGLGDWEWILAFEADELHRLVDCIRRLRDSDSRNFVKVETPFVVGRRVELPEAVDRLI